MLFIESGKKIAALVLVKYKMPDAHWVKVNKSAVVMVAVPAVIVHIPAPMFVMRKVSPAEKTAVFTVIVVADAEFIVTCWPAFAATST